MKGDAMSLNQLIEEMFRPGYDPVAAIIDSEIKRGFTVIRPGQAPWFSAADWLASSIASIDGRYARLVLIHANEMGKGALTRTIAAIQSAGLIPCIVDPTIELAAALKRRRWKSKDHGSTFEDRETVWTPPRRGK